VEQRRADGEFTLLAEHPLASEVQLGEAAVVGVEGTREGAAADGSNVRAGEVEHLETRVGADESRDDHLQGGVGTGGEGEGEGEGGRVNR
jgi:hypothetical protein